jgi:hypothetical protein
LDKASLLCYNATTSGEAVPFGKLSISQAGISKGEETLPWDQVESAKVERGFITTKTLR